MVIESREGTNWATSNDGVEWKARGLLVKKDEETAPHGHVTPFLRPTPGRRSLLRRCSVRTLEPKFNNAHPRENLAKQLREITMYCTLLVDAQGESLFQGRQHSSSAVPAETCQFLGSESRATLSSLKNCFALRRCVDHFAAVAASRYNEVTRAIAFGLPLRWCRFRGPRSLLV